MLHCILCGNHLHRSHHRSDLMRDKFQLLTYSLTTRPSEHSKWDNFSHAHRAVKNARVSYSVRHITLCVRHRSVIGSESWTCGHTLNSYLSHHHKTDTRTFQVVHSTSSTSSTVQFGSRETVVMLCITDLQ